MKKIKVHGKVIELTECCSWDVCELEPDVHSWDKYKFKEEGDAKMGLWNSNAGYFEAVDGDKIRLHKDEKFIVDEVVGYTCGQVIPTKNHGTIVLSAEHAFPVRYGFNILHKHDVEFIK